MGRHGENIRKRKDGRWEARYIQRYTEDGKAVYRYIYGKSYQEAKEKRKKEQDSVQQEEKMHEGPLLKITFGQVAKEWLSARQNAVKESTYALYTQTIRKHLLPDLADVSVMSLNEIFLQQFLQKKLTEGRLDGKGGLSDKTVSDIRSVLKMILAYGYSIGFTNLSGIHLSVSSVRPPQIKVLTREEQEKLEKAIFKEKSPFYLGIMLSLYTGLRIGEVCALQWGDFDFKAGTVSISKTVIRIQNTDPYAKNRTKVLVEKPKTNCSNRVIPLPDALLPYYRENRREDNVYVLTGTTHYMEPRACLQKYKKFLQKAGIRDYNFHVLRHTFATRCVENDFDVKSLSEIMGHSNVTITMQRYVHPSLEQKRTQMNKLSFKVKSESK